MMNDTFSNLSDIAKNNNTLSVRNQRVFEVAEELVKSVIPVNTAVSITKPLVDKVGVIQSKARNK